jgi:D-alanyl-D-alanine carboxypeptidase (penicillin-binding protein 5/6)
MTHRFSLLLTGFLGLMLSWLPLAAANAQLFETKAARAFMIDAETGTVLFSKDADKPIQPGSLAKLMTMEVTFDAIKSGRLKLDDTFVVSENAWRVSSSRAVTTDPGRVPSR